MALPGETVMNNDLSSLAWVYEELRRSLETAHKALRRYLKEAEAAGVSDVDTVDPSVLRIARTQIHQGAGALELAGLSMAALCLRTAEAAVVKLGARPKLMNLAAVEAVERSSFALLDYLSRLLAGKDVSPLALFPQYRALQELAGASRIHPADLWPFDWQWHKLPPDPHAAPRQADAQTIGMVESDLLRMMRGTDRKAATHISEVFAGLANGSTAQLAVLWRLTAAFFEAQGAGLLAVDVYVKRMVPRLLSQLRAGGAGDASDRLAQDLLFFCAQARPADGQAAGPRLAAVLEAWRLGAHVRVDYEAVRLGRFDPSWITQARKRVVAAKDVWSAVSGGETARLPGLAEAFTLVGDSLTRLFAEGDQLARALQAAATQVFGQGSVTSPELAMEVATSLLYLEATLEDVDFDQDGMGDRVRRLGQRIDDVRQGRSPGPLEVWMEELYRRVSDRQTMGSVVQELRASLSEAEKQIDQYFRDPTRREVLIPVPAQLSAMRGVLSVLGLDQASLAIVRMRDDVDKLAATEVDPARAGHTAMFDRLADNLGALSFLIDMLSVQPLMAKSLFRFDAATGSLQALMARASRTPAPVVPADADAEREHADFDTTATVAGALGPAEPFDEPSPFESTSSSPAYEPQPPTIAIRVDKTIALRPPAPPSPSPVRAAPAAAPDTATGLEDDTEMRDVFLEEAQEVIAQARSSIETLRHQPDDLGELTSVRRAFHTLKGSARMIGLREFGEAGWACEQLYNARLADNQPADADLIGFTFEVLDQFERWVNAIVSGAAAEFDHRFIAEPADAMRLQRKRLPFGKPGSSQAQVPATMSMPKAMVAAALGTVDLADLSSTEDLRPFVQAGEPAADRPVAPSPAPAAEPAIEWAVEQEPAAQPAQPSATVDDGFVIDFGDAPIPADEDPGAGAPAAAADAPAAPSTRVDEPAIAIGETVDFGLTDLDLPIDAAAVVDQGSTAEPVPALAAGGDPFAGGDATADFDPFAIDFAGPAEVPAAVPDDFDAPRAPASREIQPDFDAEGPGQDSGLMDFDFDLSLPEAPPSSRLAPSDRKPSPQTGGRPEVADLSMFSDLLFSDPADQEPAAAAPPTETPLPVGEVLSGEPQVESGSVEGSDVESTGEADLPAIEAESEQFKLIGPLRISIPLFNIYLNEADELSRRLVTELAEWAHELQRPVGATAAALAHSLAGSSGTVGYADLSHLARALEHALMRSNSAGRGDAEEARLFAEVADEIRHLLHQFAAGFLRPASAELVARLAEHELIAVSKPVALEAEPADSGDLRFDALIERSHAEARNGADQGLDFDLLPTAETSEAAASEALDLSFDDGWTAPVAPEPVAAAVPDATGIESYSAPAADLPQLPAVISSDHLGQPEFKAYEALPDPAAIVSPVRGDALDSDDDIDEVDSIEAELFPIFEEEALDLVPQLQSRMREWVRQPAESAAASACMRTLHTLKGGARLAGAMRLGEMAHRLETAIEHLVATGTAQAGDVEFLVGRVDAIESAFDIVRAAARLAAEQPPAAELPPPTAQPIALPVVASVAAPVEPPETPSEANAFGLTKSMPLVIEMQVDSTRTAPLGPSFAETFAPLPRSAAMGAPAAPRSRADGAGSAMAIDWSRFPPASASDAVVAQRPSPSLAATAAVRVRAPLLDRLVNHAGEVSITRARIEADVGILKTSLADLTDNLERMRSQLRDIELQAETQITSRMEATKAMSREFDPLEMDRFTRFQELTRMMAESVNDVATVQRGLQRTLQSTEDELAAQARLTRDMQDDLLRTRMVEFEGLAERLYRVVRQAAKETGKLVRLDIVGGSIEVDRGVLDRMTGSLEHLLRNSVTHGIESSEIRLAAGKEAIGTVTLVVTHEGNEVSVEMRDDGAGLNLPRIRDKGIALGLIEAGAQPSADELAGLIFLPGFSTAEVVTGLAGRGVGMDVVRSEVAAMGGRIETATAAGQGTSFKLVLPLTTAVTQVVMLKAGELTLAVPSTLVELVRRAPAAEIEKSYQTGQFMVGDRSLPFFWLGALVQASPRGTATTRTQPVTIIRSAAQRIVLHVDDVLGNQEVVVKNLGPQLSRLPGLAGMTLLPSGKPALIYNPVALAALFGDAARLYTRSGGEQAAAQAQQSAADAGAVPLAPLVMVVDDSLTVRRVTQRLLAREGYRVLLAKDGLDALERLADELPALVLTDIEMPRMDGFDLVRNMRADPRLAGLPVIMITSRIAQKHRDYAAELGVDHYLGKPYSEEDLLGLIARYTAELTA
jgi:chemosensory pili system protein ChpA (sensor histidine kinase/response regulator)